MKHKLKTYLLTEIEPGLCNHHRIRFWMSIAAIVACVGWALCVVGEMI